MPRRLIRTCPSCHATVTLEITSWTTRLDLHVQAGSLAASSTSKTGLAIRCGSCRTKIATVELTDE